MKADHVLTIHETIQGSHTGAMTFPEVVARLSQIGVERYHADYSRREKTFYLADGDSLTVTMPWEPSPIGADFLATAVEKAVRQSQLGEHSYGDFVRKTMSAGCVGYFVQITGRRAQYFGRRGEVHVEQFPPLPVN